MSPNDRFIVLNGAASSAIIERADEGAPVWRYWGPRLPDGTLPPTTLAEARSKPSFSLDLDRPFTVFPAFGVGWFGAPALVAHRFGRAFAHEFVVRSITMAPSGAGVEITLEESAAAIRICLRLDLDPANDVLCASSSLTNLGDTPLVVDWLAAAALPLPPDSSRVRYWSGRHNREFFECEDVLGRAVWRRENRRGLTSHDCFPGALVLADGAGRDEGRVHAAQFAWSGCAAQLIERLDDGRRQWQFGVLPAPGEEIVEPGGVLETPQVLATMSEAGANGAAQNFHEAVRKRISWPGGRMGPRKAHINTWEAFYFDLRPEALAGFARNAAAIGIERFVLDDGWFTGRHSDRAGLGDWTVDRTKFPVGLTELARETQTLGMEFGLWVEPEMVNPDSGLYREHPDWALRVEGAPQPTARNQLVLDLSRRDVSDHLFAALDALLRAYPVRYLKWDHNRELAPAGGAEGRAVYRRQTLGTYSLMDRIRKAHPEVEIEACAGGGGRIDAGIIQYTHRVWTSDCLDAVDRLSIQRGFLQFFPPEIMGAHVGAAPSHATGRTQNLDFRASVAVQGHFGVELDPARLDDADLARLAEWIGFYKSVRGLIHGARTWLGEAGDNVVFAVHGSTEDALVFVWRIASTAERQPPLLRLAMAGRDRRYRLRLAGAPGGLAPSGGSCFAALAGEGCAVDGAWLAEAGVPLPQMAAESTLILRVTAL